MSILIIIWKCVQENKFKNTNFWSHRSLWDVSLKLKATFQTIVSVKATDHFFLKIHKYLIHLEHDSFQKSLHSLNDLYLTIFIELLLRFNSKEWKICAFFVDHQTIVTTVYKLPQKLLKSVGLINYNSDKSWYNSDGLGQNVRIFGGKNFLIQVGNA